MEFLRCLFVFCLLALSVFGQTDITPNLESTTEDSETTQELTSTISSTSRDTTTDSSGTTTTTTTPETTSLAPTTTRPTTIRPTTVAPTTSEPTTVGEWSVMFDDKNGSCIHLKMAATLDIIYEKKVEDNKKENTTVSISLLSNATLAKESTCDGPGDSQVLALDYEGIILTLTFNRTEDQFFVQDFSCDYILTSDLFPDAVDDGKTKHSELKGQKYFPVSKSNSWKCDKSNSVKWEGTTLEVKNFQYQAYTERGTKSDSFLDEVNCENDVSDIVPIVVGCALAALVLVVLVAYIIGRRRSQQKAAYNSM